MTERWNKKCKNLTSNKKLPFESLDNSLVRDATARYFRWKRGCPPTRVMKTWRTAICGQSTTYVLSPEERSKIRVRCGCMAQRWSVCSHRIATVGGKRFSAGESLRVAKRCGSVVTTVVGGRSRYGLVKRFVRVLCRCPSMYDFAILTWFPYPVYPDRDPLTVRIDMNGVDMNDIGIVDVISLYDIQPSRVAVEIDIEHDSMYMMRLEGLDTM